MLFRSNDLTVVEDGRTRLENISFEVHAGEILGIIGVAGNGQAALGRLCAGLVQPASGRLTFDGEVLDGLSARELIASGVGRIPEDRHASLVPDLSVAYNLVLEHLDDYRRGLRLDEPAIRANAEALIGRFAIKAAPDDRVATLSDRKSTRLNSSHIPLSRMPSSA